MGSRLYESSRTTTSSETNKNKMASHSISSSSSSSYSSSSSHSSSSNASSGNMIQQQLTEVLLTALRTDRPRLYREFYFPEHISLTGHYYPRYRVTGGSQTGTSHVSYLARPYYNYKVPSKYGFSKFITVEKIN